MKTVAQDQITVLDLDQFRYLTEFRAPQCISVYLSTHRTGEEVQHQWDSRTLQAELRGVHKSLQRAGLSEKELNAQLKPFLDLVEDADFWRHQDVGLALFGSADRLIAIKLPYAPKQQYRISNAFYLLPLVPFLSGDANFYLLSIELERIRLFQGNRAGITEIDIREYIPKQMEERVGYELTGKDLQYRSQHQAFGQAGYHGHDGADRDRKNEILRFFQDINRGLLPILQAQPAPLILATQDYLSGLYREACTFDLLQPQTLSCNLSVSNEDELHQMAWEQLQPMLQTESVAKWEKFLQYTGAGIASIQPIEIFKGVLSGRVDTLFVNPERDVNGVFDLESGQLVLQDQETGELPSLVSEAIAQTIRHGGGIVQCEAKYLSDQNAVMGALFRY